ncbi:uncharacterized protein [Centroberyx affinis]|uniref:uncharacterized protein n=1 Tax=Centroberyx affinis TaxID=166261 RepID=UPI003A5C181E
MKNGNLSLILKNVSRNDTGTYKCCVATDRARRRKRETHVCTQTEYSSIINLKVKGQEVVTVYTGQDVTLKCQSPNNTPIIVLEWTRPDLEPEYVFFYRDERIETTAQNPSFAGRVELSDREMKNGDLSLRLKNVSRNDTGTYECCVAPDRTRRRKRETHVCTQTEYSSIINLKVKDAMDGYSDAMDGYSDAMDGGSDAMDGGSVSFFGCSGAITDYKSKPSVATNTSASLPDEFNNFYARFEAHTLGPVTAAQCPPDVVDLQVTG